MFTEERAKWLYQHYRWLDEKLPRRTSTGRGTMLLPTKQYFPDAYTHDHRSAVILFDRVRNLMGMHNWPCRFEQRLAAGNAMQKDLSRSGILGERSTHDAAGTFSIPEPEDVVITYSHHMLKDPVGLVATLAHELCHYLLATVREEPPGTWKQLEPLTDLAAVKEGFGVFLCDSAFRFSQWTSHGRQGWSAQRKGYLNEAELGFCTAIFAVRNRIDPNPVVRYLKPNPREVFCDALDYIADLEAQNPLA